LRCCGWPHGLSGARESFLSEPRRAVAEAKEGVMKLGMVGVGHEEKH
jgi:hypothetical protein